MQIFLRPSRGQGIGEELVMAADLPPARSPRPPCRDRAPSRRRGRRRRSDFSDRASAAATSACAMVGSLWKPSKIVRPRPRLRKPPATSSIRPVVFKPGSATRSAWPSLPASPAMRSRAPIPAVMRGVRASSKTLICAPFAASPIRRHHRLRACRMEYDFEDASMTCCHAPARPCRSANSPGDAIVKLSIRGEPRRLPILNAVNADCIRQIKISVNQQPRSASLPLWFDDTTSKLQGRASGIRPLRRSGANPKCPQQSL